MTPPSPRLTKCIFTLKSFKFCYCSKCCESCALFLKKIMDEKKIKVKNAKMRKNLATIWRSNNFPGGSEFPRASEGPQNCGKKTGLDILEFRDINGPVSLGLKLPLFFYSGSMYYTNFFGVYWTLVLGVVIAYNVLGVYIAHICSDYISHICVWSIYWTSIILSFFPLFYFSSPCVTLFLHI